MVTLMVWQNQNWAHGQEVPDKPATGNDLDGEVLAVINGHL